MYFVMAFAVTGCMKHDFDPQSQINEQTKQNVQNVFSCMFDENHDWCSTVSSTVTIKDIPENAVNVKVLSYIQDDDDQTSLRVLNEKNVDEGTSVMTLTVDVPNVTKDLYAMMVLKDGSTLFKNLSQQNKMRAMTRAAVSHYALPQGDVHITGSVESFASKRGWLPGQVLYDTDIPQFACSDYDSSYKDVFRAVIFSYFKNGRKYNNLPLVKESGYYNETTYPITTGDAPIVISTVYKNDGGYKEVENSDLYYYYFKEEDMTGKDPVEFLNSLPKYKAIQFNECIKGDDEICKHASYALAYFEGTSETGLKGTYHFPKGLKIGFMVRAKTTAEGGKKQGELYGDGRLNNDINNYAACNFKSSKLGQDGPRIAWMMVNSRIMMCWESGTDTDFNDIIIEVEGGIEPIITIPDTESNYYTYCFEDSPLGDYDMNDLVIKARRIDATHVEYKIMACGAHDALYVKNIQGQVINDSREVHSMFEKEQTAFINTVLNSELVEPVTDIVEVDESFSFLDEATQPYLYDKSFNRSVYLAKKGQDPHAIMIPNDFKWPLERICIKDSYPTFNSWGSNKYTATDWYLFPNEDLVF